ncbi:MAG: TonB-dependent receptor [Tannerellaceae bacterium]|jgi:outer membrane receptor for ferrienterochelin and colicin|nr:TonB-dependent receptor [Tannerellaceae bacterium]
MKKKIIDIKTTLLIFILLLLNLHALFAQNGLLKGKITDARTQEILTGVAVMIKELPGIGISSDIDGNYSISLPVGTYTVIVSYVSYLTLEITKVEITKGTIVNLDIDMKETVQNLQEVMVIARMDMEAEKALMVERRQATVAVENLGAKEMSVKGLSTVADGIKKITGISMEGSSKVYVRGLGDRYSMTFLNGFPIASPNPDNKLIPLTLFPTSIVKNISVGKVYQASVSGDYSGAHINIDTKENIGEDYFTFSVSAGGKTNTLFADFYSSDKAGAGSPFLGIVNGLGLKENIKKMTSDDFEHWQRTTNPFQTGFSIGKQAALPAIGLDFGMGKTWNIGSRKLNVLLAAGFNNDYTWYQDAYVSTVNAQGVIRDRYTYDKYTYETTAVLLGQTGYTLGRTDRISYNIMLINNTEDNYMRREGTDAEGMDLVGSNSVYHAYQLFNNQLTGKHELVWDKLFADWQASYGQTASEEPDRRQVMFVRNENGYLSLFKLNQQETMRYFGELSEKEWNGDIKLRLLLGNNELHPNFIRIGGAIRSKSRDFYSTNFYYNLKNISPQIEDIYDTDAFLTYDNISNATITISKNSLPRNKYYAGSKVYAAFADMEYYPAPGLLLSLGLRYEHFNQWTRFWTDAAQEKRAELITDDLFPALNLKYTIARNDNLRMGISRTVTRPSFLEMAPFEYKESYGGVAIRGYEDIKNGYNYNFDLRYELFQGFGDMYSLGAFYKHLETPIERVQEYAGSLIQSFRNVDKGTVFGAEIEIRKQVSKNWKVDFNASYIHTHISLPEEGLYTDKARQLQGASPYLLNFDVNYAPKFGNNRQLSISTVYNLQGPRISSVGINEVNNVVEETLHSLDFIASYSFIHDMRLKLQVKNLLNPKHTFTQKIKNTEKKETVQYFRKGTNIGISLSFDF